MYEGQLVFSQIMEFLPRYHFQKCVAQYKGDYRTRRFSCWDQFLCMSFAQLTYRESLRDIEACLRACKTKLYHMGIRSSVSRSTLAEANEKRDWRIYAVNILDELFPEAGSLYIMDRGYTDFARLYWLTQCCAFFIIRAKSNLDYRRVASAVHDPSSGVLCDQTIALRGAKTSQRYPEKLRRIKYYDRESKKTLVFLTNNFVLSPTIIAELFRCRWQIELFFKWIKQHLRIKTFYGTSENAVKTQIWIAVSTYLLVAIMKKMLKIEQSLYIILQVLSVSIFERKPILQAFTDTECMTPAYHNPNQLSLFEF